MTTIKKEYTPTQWIIENFANKSLKEATRQIFYAMDLAQNALEYFPTYKEKYRAKFLTKCFQILAAFKKVLDHDTKIKTVFA